MENKGFKLSVDKTGKDQGAANTSKNMKQYEVKTRFIFEGIFRVKAENREEARENVMWNCGLVLGGNIYTTLNNEDVDWNFRTYPQTKIVTITRGKVKDR